MALRSWLRLALLAALAAFPALPASAQEGVKLHALTLGDAPKYGADFRHLDYVNPDAPKGGRINLGATGTYDSFNQFIVKGTPAGLPGLYDTLTTSPDDDLMTEYGLLAESMEVAEDKSWVIFNLRPEARWHDGQPVTADDVVFTSTSSWRRATRSIATITPMSRRWRNWPSAGSSSSSSMAAIANSR